MDLAPFARINPCGYAGLRMTQVADLLPAAQVPGLEVAQRGLLDQLARRLGYSDCNYLGDEGSGGDGTAAPDGASDER
jgi:lipoate-protein ligase B